jgi:phage recombination protein Bet
MTELAVHGGDSLTLSSDQTYWNANQIAILRHMGVENAPDSDLAVFYHVCQRTGLDPFARQIYMIGRDQREEVNGEWVKTTKYTIQTGIDGFRLIGRRAADRTQQKVSLTAPEWAHEDGSWRPVWRAVWGVPVAARVTLKRDGEPFEAVALFDEYKQTKRNGELTRMWVQRPAGQIAKCAEALAWRMAFPQDLSGIYADEEMAQASNEPPAEKKPTGLAAALATPADPVIDVEEVDPDGPMTDHTRRHMFALLNDRGIKDRDAQIAGITQVIGRQIESRTELTEADGRAVIASLEDGAA